MNLVELLGASDLEYRCLFMGDAYENLKNVAPFLIRLEDNNAFTRSLFTRAEHDNVPWLLWDNEPGIFIRSRAPIDVLWTHFRRYTKVQDDNGSWYYLRFWEPAWFERIVTSMDPSDRTRFLRPLCRCIVIDTKQNTATLLNHCRGIGGYLRPAKISKY